MAFAVLGPTGSVVASVDADGDVVWGAAFDAWGLQRGSQSGPASPFQYTGREPAEAGLYYYRARYYSPSIGRFISEDPLGAATTGPPFVYVNNQPLSYTDPFGLCAETYDPECHYGPWRTIDGDLKFLEEQEIWLLWYAEPAVLGGFGDADLAFWCTCTYKYAGIWQKWAPLTLVQRTVRCPPCIRYDEECWVEGEPFWRKKPELWDPDQIPTRRINAPYANGCLCPPLL